MHPHGRRAILAVSLVLFLLCLTQDGFFIDGDNPRAWSQAGYLLLLGWLGLLAGVVAWLANPLWIAAWIAFALHRHGVALALSIAALVCALSFLTVDAVMVSEAPTFAKVTSVGIGYWLWIASMAALAGGAALTLIVANGRLPTQIP
jgi:hypothetical protein